MREEERERRGMVGWTGGERVVRKCVCAWALESSEGCVRRWVMNALRIFWKSDDDERGGEEAMNVSSPSPSEERNVSSSASSPNSL